MTTKTILVVDDEPVIRSSVAEAFAAGGFRIVEAADGTAALQIARSEKPDLVLLDVMLPGISGVEVCRLLRADSRVPIILLTARDAEGDKIQGFEAGADDYVTKPFSLRELAARVNAVLRRTGGEAPIHGPDGLVAVGAVHVDLPGHRVLRDGTPLAVKPQVFRLLAFLIENSGRVFSREQLLDRVWGSDFPGETRTVDVHVHALRELIEVDPANPTVLETIRGVGYVLRIEE